MKQKLFDLLNRLPWFKHHPNISYFIKFFFIVLVFVFVEIFQLINIGIAVILGSVTLLLLFVFQKWVDTWILMCKGYDLETSESLTGWFNFFGTMNALIKKNEFLQIYPWTSDSKPNKDRDHF